MAIDSEISLPSYIISCEYVNMDNEKMSKSKGNLISINELLSLFPKDSIRYYMLANGPETKDINFTMDNFVQVHNKFLVGVLGNFVNRNCSYINKKFNGLVKQAKVDEDIIKLTCETYQKVGELIEKGKIRNAIELAIEYVNTGNKYYDERKPWIQVNENIEEFNNTTYTCMYMIANISNIFAPFIPETCQKIKNKLQLNEEAKWEEIKLNGDIQIQNNDLLFERLENK